MDIFNTESKCEKCGFDKVETLYCGGVKGVTAQSGCVSPSRNKDDVEEHHHRHCKRCGYEWIQSCLGTKPEQSDITLKEEQHE